MNNSSTDTFEAATCSFAVSTALISAISLFSIGAFVGNSLVTITFLMTPSLRTSTNYFIINMVVSDILSSSNNWPLYATEGIIIRKPMIDGSVATIVCKLRTLLKICFSGCLSSKSIVGRCGQIHCNSTSLQSHLRQDTSQSCSIVARLDFATIDFHPLCIVKWNHPKRSSNVL